MAARLATRLAPDNASGTAASMATGVARHCPIRPAAATSTSGGTTARPSTTAAARANSWETGTCGSGGNGRVR